MKIYDVTLPITEQIPVYEGDPNVEIKIKLAFEFGDAANVSQICMGVHTGTHVDAPNHFIEGSRRVEDLDLEKLIGKCRVVEFSDNVSAIEAKHVENLETVERVLFKTKNSQFWNDFSQGFRKDFAYIAPEAARVLIEKGVKLVGFDYLSIEKFDAESADSHVVLLEKEVIILEGLDLRAVPAGEYELICLPMKFAGGAGDGAPARTVLRELKQDGQDIQDDFVYQK